MNQYTQQKFVGERALFQSRDLELSYCTFADGESPLKESKNLKIENCLFQWKYPLWYCRNVEVKHSTMFEMARAGIWYTDHISMEDITYQAPKGFRRCKDVVLKDINFPNAAETLWNCENVTVYDSFISGEYLGWNAKNVTLINCTIESEQGMCYMDNLKMENCRLLNTNLAFEYATVDAQIDSKIDSVKNPISGKIRAKQIDEIIFDNPDVKKENTDIVTED